MMHVLIVLSFCEPFFSRFCNVFNSSVVFFGGSSLHFYFRDFSLGSGLSGVDSYVHILAVTHHGGQRLRATFSVAFVVYYMERL